MADADWSGFSRETLEYIKKIQKWCSETRRNPLTKVEKEIVENIDMVLEVCKMNHQFTTFVSQSLSRVDEDRANLKSQVCALENELGEIKKRLEKVEK